MRRATPALVAALTLLVTPAAAQASHSQLSIFEDDNSIVLSGDSMRQSTLDDVASLGADVIHSVVSWNRLAPAPLEPHAPAGFNGADPADYAPSVWDPYDDLVREATERGLQVELSPASPVPAWASSCPGTVAQRRTCRPDPKAYQAFVQALGRRYSGEYNDENQGGAVLPRVQIWSIWNEPNQGGWLTPQYVKEGRRTVPVAPLLYRALARAAVRGLRTSGHGHDQILLGETAPIGRLTGALRSRPMPPGDFLRDTLCLNSANRPLRGVAARELDCARAFSTIKVSGIAHHPYTRGGSEPPTQNGGPDEITVSSTSRLERIIDGAGAHARLPAHLPIWFTELGFQTNPPDAIFGVPLDRQAAYINESDWIAYNNPRVHSVAQYEMRDERALAAFQTGLRFADGSPKPSYAAYRMPIWITRAGPSSVRIWGQVRPLSNGTVAPVTIEHDATGSGDFTTQATTSTDGSKGFYSVRVSGTTGSWRATYTPPDGGLEITSRIARIGVR